MKKKMLGITLLLALLVGIGIVFAADDFYVIAAKSGGEWSLNGVRIYYNAGNVGIGTDYPDYPLHV